MIAIRLLRDDEHAWANDQYTALRFAVTPPGALALVAELEGERVGLGRLVELEPGVHELGGIWTADSARNRGIARAMVTALLERARPGRLWCIPFAHLAPFYESFGFVAARPPWPAAVTAKAGSVAALRLPTAVVLVRG